MISLNDVPICEPSVSDTAPVDEGKNQCEGADCIDYDFPFAMRVKGRKIQAREGEGT